MKPLILIYYYYDESHNVLDTMEVFPYDDLIIIKKLYDFYHVNTFIDFPNIYRWTFLLLTARLLFKHLLWWAILCANLSFQEVFLEHYYNL